MSKVLISKDNFTGGKVSFNSGSKETDYNSENDSDGEIKDTVICEAVVSLLSEIIEDNDAVPNANKASTDERVAAFTYKKPPSISIPAYITRIQKYTKLESSTLIIFLIYLDRVCEMNHIILTRYNIHRLILGSMMTAIKYNEDDYYSNSFYSRVGGVTLQELNMIESHFIKLSDYSLFVSEEKFEKYRTYLLAYQD